jgi:hypothetical protein
MTIEKRPQHPTGEAVIAGSQQSLGLIPVIDFPKTLPLHRAIISPGQIPASVTNTALAMLSCSSIPAPRKKL